MDTEILGIPTFLDRRPLAGDSGKLYASIVEKWNSDGLLTRQDWLTAPAVVRQRVIEFLQDAARGGR
jgi:hypothetical protein